MATEAIGIMEIGTESFRVTQNEHGVFICHDALPISGFGRSMAEAREDLFGTIRDLRDHYANTPIDQLSVQAVYVRERVLAYPVYVIS